MKQKNYKVIAKAMRKLSNEKTEYGGSKYNYELKLGELTLEEAREYVEDNLWVGMSVSEPSRLEPAIGPDYVYHTTYQPRNLDGTLADEELDYSFEIVEDK